ncbi:unnamed protein product [Cylicocyclus nassatus]|uniref:Uncharacterized protein n=1 Tax=Cylicocyclus nassatus TaxID=53992 RepID=A0AA36HB68_CYLNA|nr:unnamed protein product [Cylicocyclus nassatus]
MHVDCRRILANDISYLKTIAKKRPTLCERKHSRDMSCETIRSRVLPPVQEERLEFGIAHVRIVYENYVFIEEELRSSYHSQNHFCYFLDKKADTLFKTRMHLLDECFPNVYIPHKQLSIDAWGHFMFFAYHECLKVLTEVDGWKYALLLQNYDLVIKSVKEFIAIYNILGGANDIPLHKCETRCQNLDKQKWDAKTLRFYNESATEQSRSNGVLKFAKGTAQVSLSRAAVEWMISTVNLSTIMHLFNNKKVYGIDEILYSSLQVSDGLGMPGHFTSACLEKGFWSPAVTRLSYHDSRLCRCPSGKSRNSICIFGIEDLGILASSPRLIANKILPDYDYAVVDCVHELLFNRTFRNLVNPHFELQYYKELPHVQYHRNHSINSSNEIDCSTNFRTILKNKDINRRRACRFGFFSMF